MLDDLERQIHTCTVCGTQEPWGPTWTWYGSWKELDDGHPLVKCCSVACRKQHAADNALDSTVLGR